MTKKTFNARLWTNTKPKLNGIFPNSSYAEKIDRLVDRDIERRRISHKLEKKMEELLHGK